MTSVIFPEHFSSPTVIMCQPSRDYTTREELQQSCHSVVTL